MRADIFMYNLSLHNPYEMLLYVWIYKLYNKKKSIEEAIQLIYKARNILLLHGNQKFEIPHSKDYRKEYSPV